MVVGSCFNFRSPPKVDTAEDSVPHDSVLSIIRLNYTVKQWVGPWWKGACLRKQHKKRVLNDITMQIKSGQITAILGNSGNHSLSIYLRKILQEC